jgi:hypothetical protein
VLIPLLLFIIEYLPLILPPFRTFSKLAETDRVIFLKRMENSSFKLFRLGFLTIKMIIAQCYFSDERVFADIEFSGPWVEE